ncbi:MAG: hypothetical protein KBC95_02865 [Candidatus Peribacteraceae bacterium]|nr:hypothetical protein [Candidatus Peribacteraceae bacterium]
MPPTGGPETPPPVPTPAPPISSTVVGRLLRDGAAATVERTDVDPTQIATLRTEIRRASTEDRRLIFGAIDAKLRQELHAEVRTGLTALRSSVTTADAVMLTGGEMLREIPRTFSMSSTTSTSDRLRGVAWMAAIAAGVVSFGAAAKGKIAKFLALLGIPLVAIAARMHGMDPLETAHRPPRPTDTPEEAVAFDETLAANVNLLNRSIAYTREGPGGGDRRLRMTAPGNGLRLEQGGRTFGMYNSADRTATQLEPFLGATSITRDADGGAAIRTAHVGGIVNVTMHMAPASFAALGAALDTPGNAVRTAALSMTIRQADLSGPGVTLARVKADLEAKGATVTLTAGPNPTLTWTSTAYLRPLTAAQIADTTSPAARIPGPGATPAPAPM